MLQHNPLYRLSLYTTISFGSQFPPNFYHVFSHLTATLSLICLSRDFHLSGDAIMLRRNLLYTAVTRAKAKVILIGQKQAVFIAIHKCDVGQRNTVLADRIVAYYNRELSKRVT